MQPAQHIRPSIQNGIPLFLAPAFAKPNVTTNATIRPFSSSICHQARKKRDLNRRRGESVIRSTGPRHRLSVQNVYRELPKPQPEADRRLDSFPMNPDHGLYGFFNKDKETVIPPEREEQHGRSWEYSELAIKSFSDLHSIYWSGLLEMNRVKTRMTEHQRLKLGYGTMEIKERMRTIRETLLNIRRVLKDRQEAYEEARLIREQTKTIRNLERWIEEKGEAQRAEEEAAGQRIRIIKSYESAVTSSIPTSSVPTSSIPSQDLPSPAESQEQGMSPPRPSQ